MRSSGQAGKACGELRRASRKRRSRRERPSALPSRGSPTPRRKLSIVASGKAPRSWQGRACSPEGDERLLPRRASGPRDPSQSLRWRESGREGCRARPMLQRSPGGSHLRQLASATRRELLPSGRTEWADTRARLRPHLSERASAPRPPRQKKLTKRKNNINIGRGRGGEGTARGIGHSRDLVWSTSCQWGRTSKAGGPGGTTLSEPP